MFQVGDIIITKKDHVCGSNKWEILRTGIDLKLLCINCKREITINSNQLLKRIKKIEKKEEIKN